MTGVLPFILRRLLWAPLILFIVSFATFSIGRYGPGDPVLLRAGPRADEEAIARIREQLGLDEPVVAQYFRYIGNVLQGDLGESLSRPGTPVADLIFPRMAVSMQLGAIGLFLTFAMGIPLGMVAALRQGTWADPFSIGVFLAFQSIPVIVMIPLLQLLFVVQLGLFPTGGWDGIFSTRIIMPVIALTIPSVAGVGRLMRATTLAVMDEDYVRTARAKGLNEFRVVGVHVARNALLPMATVVGLSMVGLLEGAFFTETLFGIPGIAQLTVQSVFQRDYDVIMAMTLIVATAFVVLNIVTDIAYTLIDPRVRFRGLES